MGVEIVVLIAAHTTPPHLLPRQMPRLKLCFCYPSARLSFLGSAAWYSTFTGTPPPLASPPPSPYVVMPQFQPSTSSSHSTACPSSRRGTAKPLGTLASLQLLVLSWLPLTTPSLRPPPPPSPLVTARICVLFSRLFLAVERSFFPPAFTALCPLSRGLFPAPLLHSSLLPLSPIRKRGALWEGACKP